MSHNSAGDSIRFINESLFGYPKSIQQSFHRAHQAHGARIIHILMNARSGLPSIRSFAQCPCSLCVLYVESLCVCCQGPEYNNFQFHQIRGQVRVSNKGNATHLVFRSFDCLCVCRYRFSNSSCDTETFSNRTNGALSTRI